MTVRALPQFAAALSIMCAVLPTAASAAAFLVTNGENLSPFDTTPATIQAVDPVTKARRTFATTPSTEVGPKAIAIGPSGDVFVVNSTTTADSSTYSVLRYNGTTGAFVSTFVPASSSGPWDSKAIAFGPDGNLYVASGDSGGSHAPSILRYNGTTGAFINVFASTGLSEPMSLAFAPDGSLYVGDGSDLNNFSTDRIQHYSSTGTLLGTLGTDPNLTDPNAMTFGPDGALYVSNENTGSGPQAHTVLRYDVTTGLDSVFVASGSGGLMEPFGLAFGPDGALYVASGDNGLLNRYNGVTGAFIDTVASGLADPKGIVYDPNAVVANVPEPGTVTLLVSGLAAIMGFGQRRRRV